MGMTDREILRAGLRHSLPAFIQRVCQTLSPGTPFLHNWHIDAISHFVERCANGDIKRLMITMPPRNLKSTCSSIALPAWILGHQPTRQIICASYSQELADKFSRDFSRVVDSDWYRDLFPNTRALKHTTTEYVTTKGGFRLATSVGGTLTGRGGNLIIVDDPLKADEAMSKVARDHANDWYRGALLSRLNNKNEDRIIIVMQRLHVDDLVGNILLRERDDWTHLDLPAIAQETQDVPLGHGDSFHREPGDVLHPGRESRETLEMMMRALGTEQFSAQYLQRPVPEGGNMVKREWFQYYHVLPEPGWTVRTIQSWDTANKPEERNDPSVCTTWLESNGKYYLKDVTRKRVDYPSLKALVSDLAQTHRAEVVIIEDRASGTSLIQDLRREGTVHPIAFKPEGDKVMRMHAQCARIEAGQVYLPREAAWLATFLEEILAFPGSRHDDQVDSLSQFLKWVSDNQLSGFEADWGDDEGGPYWTPGLAMPR